MIKHPWRCHRVSKGGTYSSQWWPVDWQESAVMRRTYPEEYNDVSVVLLTLPVDALERFVLA